MIAMWKSYASLMSDPNVEKINQNIVGFDAPFLLTLKIAFTLGAASVIQ